MKRLHIIAGAAALFAGFTTTTAQAAAQLLTGLGPYSYVQEGLVTQFDSMDNENTGTYNPDAPVWRDLKGDASITLQGSAGWSGRYFDSTYDSSHTIVQMPYYKRNSFTLETTINIIQPSANSSTIARIIANGQNDWTSLFLQNNNLYLYVSNTGEYPHYHKDYFGMGTLLGYSSTSGEGLAFNGKIVVTGKSLPASQWVDFEPSWYTQEWGLNGRSGAKLQGHYYSIRFYTRTLSEAEMMTNAVIDKLRFFSFKYSAGEDANWADIAWDAPESTAANPPTAPGNTTNDFVQIIGSQVTVAATDDIGLMGLSLENGAALDIPSGERVAVKVLYVEGQPVKRGLYSANSANGIAAAWLSGDGVVAVAGAIDAEIPSGAYRAPDANGYCIFGRTSANGGTTAYHSGAGKWYIRGERTDWENYWFPEGSKLKLVGYVLLKTIPAGVFSEIDLSEAEHILLCEEKAISDGSALVVPSGVEFRYQPVTSMSYDSGNGNYYLLSVGDIPETGDLSMNGVLRIYGDGGGLLNSQQYTGDVSGTGTIQFGNYNKAARFSGAFNFKGTATGFNPASLVWVDSLDVDASLGNVTMSGCGGVENNASVRINGVYFGRNGSGETANGEVCIDTLRGEARNYNGTRVGGALAVWGGNTIHVDTLKSALHVVGRPQDLGCTWNWFGSASAVGNGNLVVDDADFNGYMFLSTNVNVKVGNVSNTVTFDYTFHSGAVNATTLDITNSCNSGAVVTATDIAMLPARLSGFSGNVTLTDTATKSYTIPMDFTKGTNALYNTVGCIGSGTLSQAPAAGTIDVTFDTASADLVEGRYSVVRFTSGGELLDGWTVLLNGSPARTAVVGDYMVSLRRDGTGIWVKVYKSTGLVIRIR